MIYLDNAATSFPKPPTVARETYNCITKYGGNPGRSGHELSLLAAKKIYECRCELAELFGLDDPAKIIFTLNTTYALNMAIKGLLKDKDHVIISDLEHNSVLRPIYKLASERPIEYSIFSTGALYKRINAKDVCTEISNHIRPNTKLLVCTHSSNICSATLPIKEIGELCYSRGILFVLDAAQSAGHIDIDLDKMKIDVLCAPGHKGLYGPQGCGVIALRDDILLDTLTEGGNGSNSLEPFMPSLYPERYETGTAPTPAIAGLCEGVSYIKSIGIDEIHGRECNLYLYARERLMNMKQIELYAPHHVGNTLLFNIRGTQSEECAYNLNKAGICVRAGYHCSALGHKTLCTPDGGAVRMSLGAFNKKSDIDALISSLLAK